MYQIVATSEFIRDLEESTSGAGTAAAPTGFEEPAATPVPAAAARGPRFTSIAAAILGAAHRLLGAH